MHLMKNGPHLLQDPRADGSHLMDHTQGGREMPNKTLGEREGAKEQKR